VVDTGTTAPGLEADAELERTLDRLEALVDPDGQDPTPEGS
jgi:hypothetical protein